MSDGDNNLAAYAANAALRCAKKGAPYFTRFLSEGEQAEIKRVGVPSGVFFRYFAGEQNTEPQRRVLGIFPSRFADIEEERLDGMFPIKALTFVFRKQDAPNHRSVLGTLTSLGIDRDTIGDIYIGSGAVIVYIYDTVYEYVAESVLKIGGVGVEVIKGIAAEIPKRQFKEMKLSVSSLRLDTFVSHTVSVGRTAAVERYIKAQKVAVNSAVCTDTSKLLSEGDTVSVRGVGKFLFYRIDGEGRKGNIHITVKKYI